MRTTVGDYKRSYNRRMRDLPVVRSSGTRTLFLMTAGITVLLMLWTLEAAGYRGLTPIFKILFAEKDYPATLCALLILVAAVFLSPYLSARRVLVFAGTHAAAIALGSTAALALGALVVYHDHPLCMDEYAAYFQSQVFAAGRLHGQFPPGLLNWLVPPGFQEYFFNVSTVTGGVAETYWPGFALLLTPFTWAGIPWACNPILSGLTLLVIHRLALAIFADRAAAGLAVLLTLASPVIFADGISYYSMPAHLLANSVYALLLLRPTAGRAAAAGVVGSMALALHNPVPHLLFALPWVVWLATRSDRVKLLAALGAGYLPLCLLLGLGWFLFSTQLLATAHVAQSATTISAADRLQAMLEIFKAPSPAVWLARSIGMAKVWLWAVPGLLVLAAVGAVRWRGNLACRLLTASAVLTVVGYFFVPVDQGHGWGYRYFHSAWMALPLLATGALFAPRAERSGAGEGPRAARWFEDQDTAAYVTACVILSLVFGVGFRAWQIQEFIAKDLAQLPPYTAAARRVVIIDPRLLFYGADLVQNDPWLRGNEIRMLSHGTVADAAMMSRYFPELHRVYADYRGSVWVAEPITSAAGSSPRNDP
jgi:hypothetical protein